MLEFCGLGVKPTHVKKSREPGTEERARLKPGLDKSTLLYLGVVGFCWMIVRVFMRVATAREDLERRWERRRRRGWMGMEDIEEGR